MVLTGSLQLSVYITRLICKAAHVLYGILKPRLQWHYKHTLETTDSFCFVLVFFFVLFFSSFSYKMVQTTIQNICAVDNLQKKSFDSITVQLFFQLFFFSSIWNYVNMVHQNPFWTATSVMRAATHFKMLYDYCNRTRLSIIKRHMQKAPIVQLQFA